MCWMLDDGTKNCLGPELFFLRSYIFPNGNIFEAPCLTFISYCIAEPYDKRVSLDNNWLKTKHLLSVIKRPLSGPPLP